MAWSQLDVVVVRSSAPDKSKFQLEVESVAQPVVGVQVLVSVLGERDTVNLADRCASVAAGQTAGWSGRGRCRLTTHVTLTGTTIVLRQLLSCAALCA